MYEKILNQIMNEIGYNEWNCDGKEIERSYYTMGCIKGYIDMLNMMGYDAEFGGYNFDDCYKCGYLKINNEYFVKNGELQEAFFKALA